MQRYVTIVAAAGNDSWAGLAGFRPNTRTINQETELVAGMILGNCQPWFVESMNTSRWTSRAWTLQENFLSRRLPHIHSATGLFSMSQHFVVGGCLLGRNCG